MKIELFKAEDFCVPGVDSYVASLMADRANSIFNDWLAQGKKVYGSDKRPIDGWNESKYESSTHVGYLICIEPIDNAVPVREIVEVLKSEIYGRNGLCRKTMIVLADRIEKFGVKG